MIRVPIHAADDFLVYGYLGSHVTIHKHGDYWSAMRIVSLPPLYGEMVSLPLTARRPAEDVFFDFFSMRVSNLRMDDFGTLFGEELGTGRVAS